MEKIATDIYTFSQLREEGFTYVDKTEELYAMASGESGKQFFMARPRRFGKSLAVSTLKCLFEGRRDLFAGLKIEPKWDWSNIPYDMTDRQNEQMWQTIVYVVLRSIGINVNGEVKTHDGRIDLVVDLPNDVYILEMKLDRPAAEAMEQIKGKDYAGKYAMSGKRITLIGISFSAEKRTIVEDLVEEMQL